mmetsp:Transcript_90768/g.256306  ORF Transcript_90768/g.256306 Transcript_90768/m.256306 type:complete len:221 (-) Transcript_90768:735-1397(-)
MLEAASDLGIRFVHLGLAKSLLGALVGLADILLVRIRLNLEHRGRSSQRERITPEHAVQLLARVEVVLYEGLHRPCCGLHAFECGLRICGIAVADLVGMHTKSKALVRRADLRGTLGATGAQSQYRKGIWRPQNPTNGVLGCRGSVGGGLLPVPCAPSAPYQAVLSEQGALRGRRASSQLPERRGLVAAWHRQHWDGLRVLEEKRRRGLTRCGCHQALAH